MGYVFGFIAPLVALAGLGGIVWGGLEYNLTVLTASLGAMGFGLIFFPAGDHPLTRLFRRKRSDKVESLEPETGQVKHGFLGLGRKAQTDAALPVQPADTAQPAPAPSATPQQPAPQTTSTPHPKQKPVDIFAGLDTADADLDLPAHMAPHGAAQAQTSVDAVVPQSSLPATIETQAAVGQNTALHSVGEQSSGNPALGYTTPRLVGGASLPTAASPSLVVSRDPQMPGTDRGDSRGDSSGESLVTFRSLRSEAGDEGDLSVGEIDLGFSALHEAPVRLDVLVPVGAPPRTTSWVGGNPSLPEDLAWPEVDGQPAVFYAQIDCASLPKEAWGARGPRTGWLVFFVSAEYFGRVVVLHTPTLGTERLAPAPVAACGSPRENRARAWLAQITQNPSSPAPRWPLRISQIDGDPASRDIIRAFDKPRSWSAPREQFRSGFDLTRPEYQPFDWTTAMALLDSTRRFLNAQVQPQRYNKFVQAPDEDSTWEAKRDTLAKFDQMLKRYRQAKDQHPFDARLLRFLLQELGGLSVDGWGTLDPLPDGRQPRSPMEFADGFEDYCDLLETHARMVYSADPSTLPDEHRRKLLPVWRHDSEFEAGMMGGRAHGGFPYSRASKPAFLLELPSSDLLGWSFGQGGNWGVFVPVEDLEKGDFSRAWGDVMA